MNEEMVVPSPALFALLEHGKISELRAKRTNTLQIQLNMPVADALHRFFIFPSSHGTGFREDTGIGDRIERQREKPRARRYRALSFHAFDPLPSTEGAALFALPTRGIEGDL